MFTDGNKPFIPVPIFSPTCIGTSLFWLMGDQTVHEDSNNVTRFKNKDTIHGRNWHRKSAMSGNSHQLTLKKGALGDQVWDLLCMQLASYLEGRGAHWYGWCTCTLIKNQIMIWFMNGVPRRMIFLTFFWKSWWEIAKILECITNLLFISIQVKCGWTDCVFSLWLYLSWTVYVHARAETHTRC